MEATSKTERRQPASLWVLGPLKYATCKRKKHPIWNTCIELPISFRWSCSLNRSLTPDAFPVSVPAGKTSDGNGKNARTWAGNDKDGCGKPCNAHSSRRKTCRSNTILYRWQFFNNVGNLTEAMPPQSPQSLLQLTMAAATLQPNNSPQRQLRAHSIL